MDSETIILGAGIAGLLLAEELDRIGVQVLILEKSRGVGGRIATKRIQDYSFDQGAPFFTARDPSFIERVRQWEKTGSVEPWNFSQKDCWRGVPTMNHFVKLLSEGKNIQKECKVTAIFQDVVGWRLMTEGERVFRCRRLFITAPVPQSLALLSSVEGVMGEEIFKRLKAIRYEPCLAGCFLLKGASTIPAVGAVAESGFFQWISDRTVSEGEGRSHSTVVAHARGEWSSEYDDRSGEEIFAIFESQLQGWFGKGRVVDKKLHRWKFAKVINPYAELYYLNPEGTLGLAGDGFGGARVEGAALSGIALANAINTIH